MEALRHPNICMFMGACTKSNNLALVLEFCSKGLWKEMLSLKYINIFKKILNIKIIFLIK
jgi:hypothetical protein